MRKDIKAINEAYLQSVSTPRKEPEFDYDINGHIITIFDVPTVNKATDEEEPVTYVFQFHEGDIANNLRQRRFDMIVNDQKVNPDDYYVDEADAAYYAYNILRRKGELEPQYHG